MHVSCCFDFVKKTAIACIYQIHQNVLSGNKYPGPSQAVKGLMSIFQNPFGFPPNDFRPTNSFFFPGCGFTAGVDCSLKEKMASKSVSKWCIKAYEQNVYETSKRKVRGLCADLTALSELSACCRPGLLYFA